MAARGFSVIEHAELPLPDGTRLAARIWLPDGAAAAPVPAILEYLPYRKRDGTTQRDESTYPVFAAAGYAGVRVDIRGSGESPGVLDDEYSPRELADGCAVIEWLAAQPWCSGAVGMMGISWGGFNALQVAALRPPALKAVISIASTVDRFADDIHHKGGALLSANLSWAATMLAYQSRPPDPALVGEAWRAMWLERLAGEPFLLETWLAHQRRDAYWRHGSIGEDFGAVQVPALVLAGWADGYRNTPLEAVAGLGPRGWAILGPWVHKYPHFAWPKPRLDFHGLALRFWDRWLKGIDNGAEADPQVLAYVLDGPRPLPVRTEDPGRWIALRRWAEPTAAIFALHPERRLVPAAAGPAPAGAPVPIATPADTGAMGGEYFTLKPDAEMAGDQRIDDGGSVLFETAPLGQAVEILGRPVLRLAVTCAAPTALLAARLVDVHPDGAATRVSFGVLNLAHRDGSAAPRPMPPGQPVPVTLRLDACGYRFRPGHRIRLALANACWPLVLPPAGAAPWLLDLGHPASLSLPLLAGAQDVAPAEPANPDPLPRYAEHAPPATRRTIERDLAAHATRYRIHEDTGAYEHPVSGLITRQVREELWTMPLAEPDRASGECRWSTEMRRGGWAARTESVASLACHPDSFAIEASVEAFEGATLIHRKRWARTIPRDLM
jgi:hypothetical protein